jgi:hypothetical protein
MTHWITAIVAIALWLWWARSEWVLAGYRPRPRRRENPR